MLDVSSAHSVYWFRRAKETRNTRDSKENQQRKNEDNQSQVHLPLMFASVSFAKETQNIFHAEEMLILFQQSNTSTAFDSFIEYTRVIGSVL